MKSHPIGISALVLVLLGLVATVCVFAFGEGIRRLDWLDGEAAALGSMVICLVACVLGWVSLKTSTGRVAAILGTLLVLFYVFQFVRAESPTMGHPARPVAPRPPVRQIVPKATGAVNSEVRSETVEEFQIAADEGKFLSSCPAFNLRFSARCCTFRREGLSVKDPLWRVIAGVV